MNKHGVQRILSGEDNVLTNASVITATVTQIPAVIMQLPTFTEGTAEVTIDGTYTNIRDETIEIEIVDNDATNSALVSEPTFTGVGNGELINHSRFGTAEVITVTLADLGNQTKTAVGVFNSVSIKAKAAGASGNDIYFQVSQSGLTNNSTPYSLLKDLPAGTETVTSPEYEFDTAILSQYGSVPANTHRIRVGLDDITIYRQVKKFVAGKWQYTFSPAIERTITAGTRVYFVTGGRTVTLSDGVITETYTNIVTPYDLFSQIQQSSNLVEVASPISRDEGIGGNAASEFDLRTDAYHYPTYGSGSKYATGLTNITIGANASTELITLTCWAAEENDAAGAGLGKEKWHVAGSVSGSLSDATTGVVFNHPSGKFSFTVPVKMPDGFGLQKGKLTYTKNITGVGACVEVKNLIAGINVKDGDYTFTWKKKPLTGVTPDACCTQSTAMQPIGAIDYAGLGIPDPAIVPTTKTIKALWAGYIYDMLFGGGFQDITSIVAIASGSPILSTNSLQFVNEATDGNGLAIPVNQLNTLSNAWDGGGDAINGMPTITAMEFIKFRGSSYQATVNLATSGAQNAFISQLIPGIFTSYVATSYSNNAILDLPPIPPWLVPAYISTAGALKILAAYSPSQGLGDDVTTTFYFCYYAGNQSEWWKDITNLYVCNYILTAGDEGIGAGGNIVSFVIGGNSYRFKGDPLTEDWCEPEPYGSIKSVSYGTAGSVTPIGTIIVDETTNISMARNSPNNKDFQPLAGVAEVTATGLWQTVSSSPTPTPPPNPSNQVHRQLHVGLTRSRNSIGETVASDTTDANWQPVNDYWHDGSVSNINTLHYYHIGTWRTNTHLVGGPLGTPPYLRTWAIAHHADSGYIDPPADWYWQLISVNSAMRVSVDGLDQNPMPTSVVADMTYDLYSGMVRSIQTSSFDTTALTNATVLRVDLGTVTTLTAYTGTKTTYAEQMVDLFHNWELLGGTLELNDGTAWRDASNWWNGAGKKTLATAGLPPFIQIADNLGAPIYPEHSLGIHGIRYTGQARRMGMLVDFDVTALPDAAGGGSNGGNDQFGKWEVKTPTGAIIDYAYMNHNYTTAIGDITTGELGIALMSACMDKVEDGSTVTVKVENASWKPTYAVGDTLYLPVIAAQDAHLSGGNTGDNVTRWIVSGSVSGAKTPYLLDLDTNNAYSQADGSGTIDFTITQGAIPFVTGDEFKFQVEGGHYRYRIDGGVWSPVAPLTLSAVPIGHGLDLHVVPSVAPSFVAGDVYKFKALHPYSIDNAENADWQQWCWTTPIGTVNYDLGSAKNINCIAFAFASLPVGTVIEFHPRLGGVVGTPIVVTTTESMAGTAILPAPITCDGLAIAVLGTGCIGYLWAGMAWQPIYCAEVQVTTSSYMLASGGYDQRGQFIGTTTDAVFSSPEPFLNDAERDKLLRIYSYSKANNNQPIILVPNEYRPMSVIVGKIEADSFTLTDEFAHQPKVATDRYYTCSFNLKGVPNEKP